MGVVYRAEDLTLGRTVALKFMLPPYTLDDTASARFLREARSVAALDHQNICTVYEAGKSDDGHLFLAMSYYRGETLKDRLTNSGAPPVEEALDIAAQIARGLACAHAAGIVHRDLKPANVMLTAEGAVKILDFGLAKSRDQTMTVTGVAMGTVAYMSPEQLLGERADSRSDLWALGVVLFEMLAGQHPAQSGHGVETLTRALEDREREKPYDAVAVTRLVDRLMQNDPADRYQSAEEFLANLATLRAQTVAGTNSATGRGRRALGVPASGRRRAALVVGAAAVILALSLGVAWFAQGFRGNKAVDPKAGPITTRYSLAVLPLKNLSRDADQEFFADGITEELTSTLTKIEALRVIANQSVVQFKRSVRPASEIARSLGVKYLVDGSVQQDSAHVRVRASLIDAARNTSVWTRTFDRERRDVMALQTEVALAIAQEIEVAITPQDRARLATTNSVNPEAFELYLKGTQARYEANATGDFRDATRLLEAAIAKDSTFAPAYAGLAFIYAFDGDEKRARRFTDKALSLNPKLAEGHMVRGLIQQFFKWDWTESERALREAIALNPGFAEAHHELGMLLSRVRRHAEALEQVQLAAYLAPMSARFENGVAEVQLFYGHYAEALAIAERLLAADSTFGAAHQVRASVYGAMERWDDAANAWAACVRATPIGCGYGRAQRGSIYGRTGRRAEALKILDTLKASFDSAARSGKRGEFELDIASVYMGLGDRAEALNWLERGVEAHAYVLYLAIDGQYRPLYGEPRFQALLRKIGLPS